MFEKEPEEFGRIRDMQKQLDEMKKLKTTDEKEEPSMLPQQTP